MPVATADVTVASGRIVSVVTIPVELKQLATVSVLDNSNALQPNDTWVELGLMSGGITPSHRVATLASGYTGRDNPVSWSGRVIAESDMFIYARITSSTGGDFRLVALVIPLKITSEGVYLLDP